MLKFDPKNHINNLIDNPDYEALVLLRNIVASKMDSYFQGLNAPRVDLYMVTGSVSSPMGKGSDSEPWPIKMGKQQTNLVDSAQFGMEPLVQRGIDMVYCYLPSFRGEPSDASHLSQFYHCEAEVKGDLEKCLEVAEGLMSSITAVLSNSEASRLISTERLDAIKGVLNNPIGRIRFKDAVEMLGIGSEYVEGTPYGRKITRSGEIELSKRLYNHESLFWITGYDRDTAPFYQKPDPASENQVLNADLILPLVDGAGFSGEVLGAGQRQDSVEDMKVSMQRQGVEGQESYNWYLDLRQRPDYAKTSGFGLGVERLISWLIGTDNIASAAIYPVMNNIKTEY